MQHLLIGFHILWQQTHHTKNIPQIQEDHLQLSYMVWHSRAVGEQLTYSA